MTTVILKLPIFRYSVLLRTLTLVSFFLLLSPVGNVQALYECSNPNYCPNGICMQDPDGTFRGCCIDGTPCYYADGKPKGCCHAPTPYCSANSNNICVSQCPAITCTPPNILDKASCACLPPKPPKGGPCKVPGCIIGSESQTLGEFINVTGTPLSLYYQSDLVSIRRELGLGGWTLNVLHSYNREGRTIFLGNGDQRVTTARDGSSLPGSSILDIFVVAEDGSELYIFNNTGQHLRTLDALTGSVRFQFTYDGAGRLVTITDGDNNVTTIGHDGSGNPSGIVAPFGQLTMLAVDIDGYLSSVTNPAGKAVKLAYKETGTVKGLLATLIDPRGKVHSYTYDALGHLVSDKTPIGGVTNLTRSDIADGHYNVALTTALGLTTVYEVEELSGSETVRRIDQSGLRTEALIGTYGLHRQTYADGAVERLDKGPDPRFGLEAPINKNQTFTTPAGLIRTTTTARTVSLTDSTNPLSLTNQTDTVKINNRTYTRVYDATSRAFTDTTPVGRKLNTMIDAKGRMVQAAVAGTTPVQLTYDGRGRLASMIQGDRIYTLTYNSQGYVSKLTDPLARNVRFTYNLTGRVTRQTLPDGQFIRYGYDSKGNMTSLTPPGRPAHAFTYTAVDQLKEYRPPLLTVSGNTLYTYDLDKKISRITQPDGQLINFGYDAAQRLNIQTTPTGSTHYAYNAITGDLNHIATDEGEILDFTYDGPLLTKVAFSGAVVGDIGFSYNNNFQLVTLRINGANPISFSYDADNLLTQAGVLALTRDAQSGSITGTALGVVTDTFSYNGFKELSNYTAKVSVAPVFSTQFTRDKLGRITQKIETINGTSHTYDYSYDLAGRLTQVSRDGTVSASYTYDSNGNRLTGPASTAATYDDQDRLLSYNGSIYVYTANGELNTKTKGTTTTNYQYDVLGNLKQVILPNGTHIDYLIDGQNRRIGKKIEGFLKQGFLYQDQLQPIVELDGAGNIVSRFVYGAKVNVPEYMIKSGITYRIVTDYLGSPRLVINTTNGSIAQRMDFDEFGRVIADTAPGFQPFGYAGGLYDLDTKLVRFGSRDYDAETGRWIAKDPIGFTGGDTNLYGYVYNDPINLVDPLGKSPSGSLIRLVEIMRLLLELAGTTNQPSDLFPTSPIPVPGAPPPGSPPPAPGPGPGGASPPPPPPSPGGGGAGGSPTTGGTLVNCGRFLTIVASRLSSFLPPVPADFLKKIKCGQGGCPPEA